MSISFFSASNCNKRRERGRGGCQLAELLLCLMTVRAEPLNMYFEIQMCVASPFRQYILCASGMQQHATATHPPLCVRDLLLHIAQVLRHDGNALAMLLQCCVQVQQLLLHTLWRWGSMQECRSRDVTIAAGRRPRPWSTASHSKCVCT